MFEIKLIGTLLYLALNVMYAWVWLDLMNRPNWIHVAVGVLGSIIQLAGNSLFIRKLVIPYFKSKKENK